MQIDGQKFYFQKWFFGIIRAGKNKKKKKAIKEEIAMEKVKLAITVLGGLSIFVYGMGLMSEGLTQIAGARLKKILAYVTRNSFMAILAGAGITALIQSSSATTVMTVGFVNAGLLDLTQAIGVIFGANIGTTITGQIVSLKLNDLALPAVTLGVAGLMLAKRAASRGTWKTILGFGLLFLGMTMMGGELKTVAKEPGNCRRYRMHDDCAKLKRNDRHHDRTCRSWAYQHLDCGADRSRR